MSEVQQRMEVRNTLQSDLQGPTNFLSSLDELANYRKTAQDIRKVSRDRFQKTLVLVTMVDAYPGAVFHDAEMHNM